MSSRQLSLDRARSILSLIFPPDGQRAHTRGGDVRPGGNSGLPSCPFSHSHFTGALHALEHMCVTPTNTHSPGSSDLEQRAVFKSPHVRLFDSPSSTVLDRSHSTPTTSPRPANPDVWMRVGRGTGTSAFAARFFSLPHASRTPKLIVHSQLRLVLLRRLRFAGPFFPSYARRQRRLRADNAPVQIFWSTDKGNERLIDNASTPGPLLCQCRCHVLRSLPPPRLTNCSPLACEASLVRPPTAIPSRVPLAARWLTSLYQ